MTLLDNAVSRMARTKRSQSARLIPLAAAVGDLLMLALAVFIAMIGRQELTFFDPTRRRRRLRQRRPRARCSSAGLAMLLAVGAYARDIFGAGHRGVQAGRQGLAAQRRPGRDRLLPDRASRSRAASSCWPSRSGRRCCCSGAWCFRRSIQHTRAPRPPPRGRDHRREPAPHRRGGRRAAPRVVARLHGAGRAHHARRPRWWRPRPASRSSAPPPTPPPRSRASAPTSSSSPTAPSPAPTTCGARCGTSRPLRSSAIVVPSLTDVSSERLKVRPVAGLPLVHLEAPRALHASHWAKRAFDVVGSLVPAGADLAPCCSRTALAVKLHDGGPVLFRQTRVGRDGRPFSCLKFRTMVTDAESLRADLEATTSAARCCSRWPTTRASPDPAG